MDEESADHHALAQWKLVRSAIEHENTLVSHRVSWFLATQLFLFAGFSSIFVKAVEKDLLLGSVKVYRAFVVISCIGFYICVLAWANMRAAGKMMGRLRDWWIRNYHPENDDFERWKESIQFFGVQKSCPPVNGIFTENMLEYFGEKRLPAAIAICWLLLLVLTTSVFIQRRANPAYSWVFLVIGCIAIGVGLWILTFKKEKIKYWLESDNDRLQKELIVLHDEIHRVHPRQPTPSQQPNSSCQVSTQD